MQVCRHCGWENPEIAAFCTNCGTGLGRGRATGPRFRALGLSGEFEEASPSAVDAAWPTTTGKPGAEKPGPLGRTLVDFPAPELDANDAGEPPDDAPAEAETPDVVPDAVASTLVPPPRHAAVARRTTGPVLLPDEAASSVDISPVKTEALERVTPSTAADPEAITEDLDAPADEPEGEAPADAAEPTGEQPVVDDPVEEAEAPASEDEQQITEPHSVVSADPPPAADSLEEDGFDEFVDPTGQDSVEERDDGPDDEPAEVEIAAPDDSLGSAIDDFARDAEVRIEPPSDAPDSLEEFEDELELSTSDLHTVDLSMDEEPDPLDPGSTHPAVRAVPPPLPAVSIKYVLRPFSQRDGHRQLVPIADSPVVIGRSDGDVHVADDDFVSPRHARFAVQDAQLVVDDLDSLNGVWLRVRVDARLDNGDEILIGQQLLRVEAMPRRNGDAKTDGTRRLGMAANGRRFRVAQLADDGAPLDVYHLSSEGCRIGRRLGDIVFTDDTYMSGTHALLVPDDDNVVLRDLSSRNGCWVRIRGQQALETGDAVMIGRTVWRIGRPVG